MTIHPNSWIQFWYCPWLSCDSSWGNRFPLLKAIEMDEVFSRVHCSELLANTGTLYREPPVKNDVLMTLVSMTEKQRHLSLALAGEIVVSGSADVHLDNEQLTWCKRIGGGLRSGGWISDQQALKDLPLGLFLLYQWADSQDLWDRARWLSDYQSGMYCEQIPYQKVSVKQLTTLWGAAVWQATR